MRSSIQYTLIRLLIFLGCMVLLWFIPWMREHGIVLLFAAATLSMLISVFALNGMRNRMSSEIATKIEDRQRRHAEQRSLDDQEHEDYEDDYADTPQAGERYR